MPKKVSEIPDGNQFTRDSDQFTTADSATRTFRIILNDTTEVFDIQQECQVFIGDPHPVNNNIACHSFSSQYEGDSRTVLTATFNYRSEPSSAPAYSSGGSSGGGGGGGSPKTLEPYIRPANWSVSTEPAEYPITAWSRRFGDTSWGGFEATLNTAYDKYEGVNGILPLTTITVSQIVDGTFDPTAHTKYVGCINSDTLTIGSLTARPHQLMLRGLTIRPHMESHGRLVYRGFIAEYTFAHRVYYAPVSPIDGGAGYTIAELGWDIAIPVEGRNVRTFDPLNPPAGQPVDPFGQPLHMDNGVVTVPPRLPNGMVANQRARAHVKIPSAEGGGLSVTPAGAPIALNADGTPRDTVLAGGPIIWAYAIYQNINMAATLRLRLT